MVQPVSCEALCQKASSMEWVVYAKPPVGGPEQILKYLARYTLRVAISNRRLLSMEDGRVTFEWKDYADGNQTKTMTLEAVEFIRRFLLHRAALWLCSHPSFWLSGQPQTKAKTGALPVLAGWLASCQRTRRTFLGHP